jgi:ferredoxin
MSKLVFSPSGFEIDLPVGSRIVDVCDDNPRSEVPFSCRSASCGTCRVQVVEGANAFPRPEADEEGVLEIFAEGPDVRLACQLRIVRDVPRIVLRVVEP